MLSAGCVAIFHLEFTVVDVLLHQYDGDSTPEIQAEVGDPCVSKLAAAAEGTLILRGRAHASRSNCIVMPMETHG